MKIECTSNVSSTNATNFCVPFRCHLSSLFLLGYEQLFVVWWTLTSFGTKIIAPLYKRSKLQARDQ